MKEKVYVPTELYFEALRVGLVEIDDNQPKLINDQLMYEMFFELKEPSDSD